MAIRTGRERLSESDEPVKNPAADTFAETDKLTHVSPRKMIEKIIAMLRKDPVPSSDVQKLMKKLLGSLRQRFGSNCGLAVFEDAVQYAPWLTAETERLKKQQSELLQSLTSCCLQARRINVTDDVNRRLLEQLSDFAENYIETETEQELLFQKAFPGPNWVGRDNLG